MLLFQFSLAIINLQFILNTTECIAEVPILGIIPFQLRVKQKLTFSHKLGS